ncbi:hypothetical protein AYJ54_00635 [Bradyrhizobium centrolobii]|uniref:Uncharacterized protein n=1 Tax=Bradyrhizobium centrolobii TaxID=1505087 RepID=A0A176YHQ9_9BRAD|nr:hypothetical protein [Bradyrhizobium centrolobii]OAF05445.1 hypothetical protein AYJ54_00635 [Bradyrhizobium centrolobii]
MSDIGDIVEALVAAGTPPALAAQMVARAFQAGIEAATVRGIPVDIPVDKTAEKRRAYDRERKRVHRNSGGIPPDSAECPILPLSSSNLNRKRGERLPPDWTPAEVERNFARKLGWSETQIDAEAANFRDYWIAKPGSGGVKLDWPATWRKWIRSSKVKPAGRPIAEIAQSSGGFYAKFGSEEQDAWDSYRKAREGKPYPRDSKGGWQHTAQWPPGYTPLAVDQQASMTKLRTMQ